MQQNDNFMTRMRTYFGMSRTVPLKSTVQALYTLLVAKCKKSQRPNIQGSTPRSFILPGYLFIVKIHVPPGLQ